MNTVPYLRDSQYVHSLDLRHKSSILSPISRGQKAELMNPYFAPGLSVKYILSQNISIT